MTVDEKAIRRSLLIAGKTIAGEDNAAQWALLRTFTRKWRSCPHHEVIKYTMPRGLDGTDNRGAEGGAPEPCMHALASSRLTAEFVIA